MLIFLIGIVFLILIFINLNTLLAKVISISKKHKAKQEIIFTLFWLSGKTQTIKGKHINKALKNANINPNKFKEIDFYMFGNQKNKYKLNKNSHKWETYRDNI